MLWISHSHTGALETNRGMTADYIPNQFSRVGNDGKTSMRRPLLLAPVALLLAACGGAREEDGHGCRLPPQSHTESDLVGTWVAGSPQRSDTLILTEEGTYRQIIHIEYLEFQYESPRKLGTSNLQRPVPPTSIWRGCDCAPTSPTRSIAVKKEAEKGIGMIFASMNGFKLRAREFS